MKICIEINLSLENVFLGIMFTAIFGALGFKEAGVPEGIAITLCMIAIFLSFMTSKFEVTRDG